MYHTLILERLVVCVTNVLSKFPRKSITPLEKTKYFFLHENYERFRSNLKVIIVNVSSNRPFYCLYNNRRRAFARATIIVLTPATNMELFSNQIVNPAAITSLYVGTRIFSESQRTKTFRPFKFVSPRPVGYIPRNPNTRVFIKTHIYIYINSLPALNDALLEWGGDCYENNSTSGPRRVVYVRRGLYIRTRFVPRKNIIHARVFVYF